jgi:SSS family solute:Na+ symporter
MTRAVRGYTLAFIWYVPLGAIVTLLVGGLLSLTHPSRAPV